MATKPTYEELEQKVKEFEKIASKRKQAEEELRKIRERLELAMNDVEHGFWDWNLDTDDVYFSPRYYTMLGYEPGELPMKLKTWVNLMHPDDQKTIVPEVENYVKNAQPYEVEFRLKTKDGDWRWISGRGKSYEKDKDGISHRAIGVHLDINERKRTEEKLYIQQAQIKSLFDYSKEAMVLLDIENHIINVNSAFEDMFGYSFKEVYGKIIEDLICPERFYHTEAKELDEHSLHGMKGAELIRMRKDGKEINVCASAGPIKVNNITTGRFVIFDDISERRQAEEALQESEKNLKAVLSTSPVGIGLVINRKMDWANETMYRMVGYEQGSLLGQSSRVLYPNDKEFERVGKQFYDGIKESGTGQAETRWLRKDGTVFDCIVRVSSLDPLDPAKGQIVTVTDVSELKRAHKELRESDLQHRLLVENASDAIFIAQDEVVKFPNPKAEEMTGYSVEELIKTSFVDLIHPKDRDMVLKRHKKRLAGMKTPTTYSFRIINKVGEELRVQLNTALVTWEGRPATINLLRDITEQTRLENQLQQAKKMETIGILAGGVAHDLNNILSGIVSYPELLLLKLPEDDPLKKPLLTIKSSGEKAVVVVQDLLTMARRGVSITEIVNLNSIISEQLKSPECENLKSFHLNVDIKINLEKDLLNIKGSTAHLGKTVFNLISNAAEAMPDGGKVLISTENLYIDRPIKEYDHVAEGDYVTVTVSDTGIGISEEDIERIFEPFYTKKVMGRSGSGLGMSVVWGTVKDHNGYIDVQSTEGGGTTFTLYFPGTREKLPEDKSSLSIEDYMGKGESILIVDDVEEQRDIASGMLKELGYSVASVSSGEEAVEYLKFNKVDLLLLDMIMDPGMDGLDTYKKILEIHPGQKAIIASGFSETDRVKEVQSLGAGVYIRKPLLLEKIGLAVKEELEK